MTLVKRLVKGQPLSAAEYDAVVETVEQNQADIVIIKNAQDFGEGRTYLTLAAAMAVSPLPANNVPFVIQNLTPTADDGKYIYLSTEVSGYKKVGEILKKASAITEDNEDVVTAGQVFDEFKKQTGLTRYPIPQTGNTPTTEPAPTQNGIYRVKTINATYTNFGGIVVPNDAGFIYDIQVSGLPSTPVYTLLSTDVNITIDATPTPASTNALQSGGAKTYIDNADATLQGQLNELGLENPTPNKVANASLTSFTGWTNVGGILTDGVVYYGQQNHYTSQFILFDEQPIGTKFVFTAKMKSIAENDYFFKVTLLNNGVVVSGGSFTIKNNTDSSFLREDGYYQILKLFTTTAIIDQINLEFKPRSSGSSTYASGEGVFATQPYIATYEDGQEFYFTENNYFPPIFIKDYSKLSLTARDIPQSIKDEIQQSTIDSLAIYDNDITVNMLGDSYTELGYDNNRGFMFFAANYLGLDRLTNFKNFGIGGTRLANNSLSATDSNAMVNRYTSMPKSDALGILGGFNDSNAPFATWTEKLGSVATITDTNTIWGALATIIEGRKTQFPYAITNNFLLTYPYTKGFLDKIALNETIRDVASYYNLPVLDLEKECGIIDGFNASLNRPSLANGYTWIDERRISFADGKTIWNIATNPTSSANLYSYIPDFIPVDNNLYQYINRSTQSNILQYAYNGGVSGTDADYDFLGNDLNSTVYEIKLDPTCTHIRFSVLSGAKNYKYSIVDGEYVTDNTHLNLLGMRDKVAPLYTEFLKSILRRKLLV